MCRWLAYAGQSIAMSTLLFQPTNSLIRQSLSAQRSVVPTNGDGFGLGWYGDLAMPGLYRDTMPAWNDANLRSLSEQIRSALFFAHVRASTGTATTRLNCHPFRYGHWLFMHNGKIGGYSQVRRELEHRIAPLLYNHREGSTDSELFFYLALANGLDDDPPLALARTMGEVRHVMDAHGVSEPLRMTAALSDGERVFALRYSSDGQSPSLFFAEGGAFEVLDGECQLAEGSGAVLILSEPLDAVSHWWREVPEGQILAAADHRVRLLPFAPVAGRA